MTQKKASKVQQAYERCAPARNAMVEAGFRCMEVTEGKCGILWERWITPKGVSVVLFATPSWCDVFSPLTDDGSWDETIRAIKSL